MTTWILVAVLIASCFSLIWPALASAIVFPHDGQEEPFDEEWMRPND